MPESLGAMPLGCHQAMPLGWLVASSRLRWPSPPGSRSMSQLKLLLPLVCRSAALAPSSFRRLDSPQWLWSLP